MTAAGGRGAILMTYGSPESLDTDDVRTYLARVRRGRDPDPDLVTEFTRRYRRIGGSPLIDITRRQAAALEARLGWPVEIGMRFSEPSIERGLRALMRRHVDRAVGVILSPQYSALLMSGYEQAVAAARDAIGAESPMVAIAGAWHRQRRFVAALADRVRSQRDAVAATEGRAPHVLLTAHSLPRRVADQEPAYLAELQETALAVAAAAGMDDTEWTFCWQSAGHEPGEWMKPDFADLMPSIVAAGARSVLVAPVQFLADHLETLYDVDVGAREQAERAGLGFRRVAALNDDPGLIEALASVALETMPSAGRPAGQLASPA